MSARILGRSGVVAVAFAAGSIPFAQYAARLLANADLRHQGNGTVSASSLKRVAGIRPLVVVGLLDLAKGTVGPLLAGPHRRPGLAALAAAAGVSGHNWSPILGGAGGRGISTAMGALLIIAPEGAAVLLGGVAVGRLVRQTALGTIVADTALLLTLTRRRGRAGAITACALLLPMLAKRLLGNSPAPTRSTYLWRFLYDRDERHAASRSAIRGR